MANTNENENEKNKELINELQAIQARLKANLDGILVIMEFALTNPQVASSAAIVSDIQEVITTCKAFLEKLSNLASEKVLAQINGDQGLNNYLLEIRHDFHNSINIIQGYCELVLMDLQKKQHKELIVNFAEALSLITKVLKVTNEIRMDRDDEFDLEKYNHLTSERETKLEEYELFKDQIYILVVDDILENCKILERYLHQLGYKHILLAHDGVEALEMLDKNKIDLLLLDIDMPRMSGKEVLGHLKNDIVQGRLMVLIISGYDAMRETVECIRLGAQDLISKPFNKDLLNVRINTCVEKRWFEYKEIMYKVKLDFIKGCMIRSCYVLYVLSMFWRG